MLEKDLTLTKTPPRPRAWTSRFHQAMDAFAADLIKMALWKAGGNQSAAARDLGITRTALAMRVKRHGLVTQRQPSTKRSHNGP